MALFKFPKCPVKNGSKVFVYIRDSGGAGQDIASQYAYADEYCKHYQLKPRFFIDRARSGRKIAGRKSFNEMLKIISSHSKPQAAGVAFFDYSRLSRGDIDDSQFALALARNRGYIPFSMIDEILPGIEGRFMELLKIYSAYNDNEVKSQNVKRGHTHLINLGQSSGVPIWPRRKPFGFINRPHDTGDTRNDGSRRIVQAIYPDSEKAPLIRKAYELKAQEATDRDIEQAIGLFNLDLSSCPYYELHNRYRLLFTNPIYRGDVQYDGQLLENYVEPIVSRELWQAVNKKCYQRPRRGQPWPEHIKAPREGTSPHFLFWPGLLRCNFCHSKLYCTKRHKPAQDYTSFGYRCKSKVKRSTTCESSQINATLLEPTILQHIVNVFLTPEIINRLVEGVNEMFLAQAIGTKPEDINQEIERLNRQHQKLIQLAARIPDDEAETQQAVELEIRTIGTELQQLKQSLAMVDNINKNFPVRISLSVIDKILRQWRTTLLKDTLPAKRMMIRQLVNQIEVRYQHRQPGNYAVINYKFPLSDQAGFYFNLAEPITLNAYQELFNYQVELP